jgi:Protein of unknown function (DUF2917)
MFTTATAVRITAFFAAPRAAHRAFATRRQLTVPTRLLALFKRVPAPSAPAVPSVRTLEARASVRIARPMGSTVSCEAGTLWLTFDKEPQDLIVEAGQSHHCTMASGLVIHALTNARLTVG